MAQSLLLLALSLPYLVASSRALRRPLADLQEASRDDNPNITAIHEKWDKMDDFLEAMFTISCKWKHGKDVNGLAAEKLQNGELNSASEVRAFKKKTHEKNVGHVTEACGLIVASGKGKCRQGCADRWGEAMDKRSQCDGKCVLAYGNFEKQCTQKAEHLEKVYASKLSAAKARETCYEGFCGEFPSVWLKDADAMTAERNARCEPYCAEALVEQRCQMKWQLQVDFVKNDVTSSCFSQGTVKECFKTEQEAASSAQGQCASDGKATCQSQYETCKTDGKVDTAARQAKEFCDERLKMCETQVTKRCLDEHKTALEAGRVKCEGSDAESLEKCQSDKLAEKEKETVASCKEERGPKCTDECHAKCNVEKMNGCLKNLESDYDPTEMFCKDFWQLLHESSEVDPVTGNPIVLLASKGH